MKNHQWHTVREHGANYIVCKRCGDDHPSPGPCEGALRSPPPDFVRASGDQICDDCGLPYRRHPHAEQIWGYDDKPFLRKLCDGTLVKL